MHAKGMGSNKKPLDSHQKVAQHIVTTRSKDYFSMLCRLFVEVSQADFLGTIVVVAVGSLTFFWYWVRLSSGKKKHTNINKNDGF